MDGLDGILNEVEPQEAPAPEPELQEIEQSEPQPEPEQQDTGEAPPTPPVGQKEDPRAKGIEAALIAERRRRQLLEQELQQLRQPKQEAQKPQGEPKPEEFQSYEEYLRAQARYEARQEFAQQQREAEEKQRQRDQQTRQQEMERAALDRVAKGQAKYADFDAAINNGLAPFLTPSMQEELIAADNGHDVAYYLGKNPAEAMRISQLSERAMMREIGRLEERLAASAAPPRPTIPQTLTQARDARGQFAQRGPDSSTPLDAILAQRK